jgi:hypothetical protein
MKHAAHWLAGWMVASCIGMPGLAAAAEPRVTQATLLDRIQIEDLMIRFYRDLTRYDAERNHLDDVFEEGAVMEVNGLVLRGRAAIAQSYATRRNENVTPGATLNMILGNPQIVVQGNTATLDALWTGILNIDLKTPPKLLQQGTDHAEFVKTNGQWRIRNRVIRSLSNMPQAWDGD